MRKEREVLEQVAASPLLRREVDGARRVEPHVVTTLDSADVRPQQARADPQDGRLCPMARQARRTVLSTEKATSTTGVRASTHALLPSTSAPPTSFTDSKITRHRHEHGRECERSRKVRGEAVVDRQWHRLVIPRNEPANMSVAPNSPSARPSASAVPATSDGIAAGIEIRANVRASDAPEGSRRVDQCPVHRAECSLRLAHVEGRGDEGEGYNDARRLEHELDPGIAHRSAEDARGADGGPARCPRQPVVARVAARSG